jgi:hypothetical protein
MYRAAIFALIRLLQCPYCVIGSNGKDVCKVRITAGE